MKHKTFTRRGTFLIENYQLKSVYIVQFRKHFWYSKILQEIAEAYSEPSQIFQMDRFAKIAN